MVSLRFALLAVTLLAVVSAYGPPKKGAVPPNPEKYETDEKSLKKGDELDKAPEDVLYVKGQPVEGGKGEDLIDESSSYGGKYGGEKKIKEVKVEETSIDLGGGGYGGKPKSGKKSYGGDESYTKEVKEVKYDDKGKFGPEEGKFEEVKEETKLDKGYGGAGGYGGEVIKEIKEEKQIKKYGGKGGYGGGGYGGGSKKEIIKEEVIKEDNYGAPPKGSEGGYLIPDDSKAVYPEPDVPKESYGDKGPKGGDFGGYGKQEGKKGGYGAEEKFEESKEGAFGGKALGPKGGYGGEDKYGKEEGFEGKGPKGGYGGESPKGPKGGYGKGGYGEEKIEEKIEENFKEEGAGYGGGKPLGPKGGYGKGGYGKEKIEEKIEENFKEEGAGYGGGKPLGPKGGYGKGGIVEEKIEETYKEGGSYGGGKPKGDYGGGYGGDKKVIEETKEIKTEYGGDSYGGGKKLGGGYGGGYGGEKKFDEGYGPKPGESFTTLSTKSCNKLMDGLFGKLQNSFTGHMSQIKMDKFSPVQIGGWARVRLYDGKMDNIGKICRGGDFQVLPQGENIIIRGTITVPEPKAKFCGDAYLYNRLKVRNRNLMLCAKDASFRMQMIINKRVSKVDVDELEPIGMHGFHVEDDKGLKSDALAWPFNKIRDTQLTKQKYQLMSTLQHKLCDDFRQIVAKPEIKEEILRLV